MDSKLFFLTSEADRNTKLHIQRHNLFVAEQKLQHLKQQITASKSLLNYRERSSGNYSADFTTRTDGFDWNFGVDRARLPEYRF
mmetsp:Transcript_12738/g.17587  ORF Transcript_12738/g.17587 Transcript_12738/m.17587 type:complete len:84 (-) Transcript_12738:80-331(-)